MEQYIATQELVRLGVAIQPQNEATAEWLTSAIQEVLTLPGYKAAAERIALKYRRHDATAQLEQLVDVSTAALFDEGCKTRIVTTTLDLSVVSQCRDRS